MSRTKKQRVVDGFVHWSIAAAIASVVATFVIERAVTQEKEHPKAYVVKDCQDTDCYKEIKSQLAEIEQKLESVEPTLVGSPPK